MAIFALITAASCRKCGRNIEARMVHSSVKMLKAAIFSLGVPCVTHVCRNGSSSGQPPGSLRIAKAACDAIVSSKDVKNKHVRRQRQTVEVKSATALVT